MPVDRGYGGPGVLDARRMLDPGGCQHFRGPDNHHQLAATSACCQRGPQNHQQLAGSAAAGPVGLHRCFSNPRKPLRALISHGYQGIAARPRHFTAFADHRSARPGARKLGPDSNPFECLESRRTARCVRRRSACRQLAARFKVHRGTVSEIARRAGLEPRVPTLPQPVREEAARLYADGLTLVEVGVKLGISHNAVRSAVVACGGTLRPAGRARRSPDLSLCAHGSRQAGPRQT